MKRSFMHRIQWRALGTVALTLVVSASVVSAQRQPAGKPAWKGIWEPVSYPDDVYLTNVFFVNPDVGWVTSGNSYEGGMVLQTRDAGATWTVALGDRESKEPAFHSPYFLDERQGWVLQRAAIGKSKVLRTDDGDTWQQVGAIDHNWGLLDYAFLSRNLGLYLDGNDNVARIMRTTDGGRTWNEVFKCRAKVVIDGLARDIQCNLKAMHFPTANVGYAIGGAHGAKRTLFVAKTKDGGARWTLDVISDIGGDLEVYHDHEVFFTDENTGFAHLSENRLYSTKDGGRTWAGLVGTPGKEITFADPEVGWSFAGARLSYTTDGGKRWSSRELSFPAKVHAFSLPRRNRAYVVGEHGMIFRYSVVPSAEPTPPSGGEGPTMPAFEAELAEQVETVETAWEQLETQIETATEAAGEAAADTAFIVNECCVQPVNEFQNTVNALTPLVPKFLAKHRNVNLIIAGLQFLGLLPDHLAETKAALAKLRQARGPTATAAALAELSAAVETLRATTRQAFQKEPMEFTPSDVGASSSSGSSASTTQPSTEAAAEEVAPVEAQSESASSEAEEAKRKIAEEAKKKAKEEAKKKLRIRFP
ncbi:MAG: hypothetical protein M3125_00395 [Gemmatimonadota bacterium]|nr:hypothetical protein [Gemmatimonadota bacterium]